MVNDFTYIGPNPGESVIAYYRTKQYIDNPNVPGNKLDFGGDQTLSLGDYMGVLATEY